MERADPVQDALCLQGLHLGQQASEISELNQGIEMLHSRLIQVAETLSKPLAIPSPPPSPPGPMPQPTVKPCLPAPECYAGDPGKCQSFLSTRSLVLEL